MAAKNRIVQFYEKYSDKGKPFTVQHFMEEVLSRRTIYRTLQTFKERGTTKRKDGSERPAKILTKQKLAWLCRKLVHGKLNNSQTAIVSKMFQVIHIQGNKTKHKLDLQTEEKYALL